MVFTNWQTVQKLGFILEKSLGLLGVAKEEAINATGYHLSHLSVFAGE